MKVTRVVLALCFFLVILGCGPSLPSAVNWSTIGVIQLDFSKVIKRGNFSFIPLDIRGLNDDFELRNHAAVLEVLKQFEEANPKLEICSWKLEHHNMTFIDVKIISGIWISVKEKKAVKKH